jgi:hypothetical protein
VQAGDTFFLEGVAERHLWVIISDPSINPERVLLVSMTSFDVTKEDVCLLDPGDHPFVKHKTCIDYSHAREASLAVLVRLRDSERLRPDESVSADLLGRIRRGVSLSRDIKFKYVELLLDQGVID